MNKLQQIINTVLMYQSPKVNNRILAFSLNLLLIFFLSTSNIIAQDISIWTIGNTAYYEQNKDFQKALKLELQNASQNDVFIHTGNFLTKENIEAISDDNNENEAHSFSGFDYLKGFKGKKMFVSGKSDVPTETGYELRNELATNLNEMKIDLVPNELHPGPEEIIINDDLVIIAIDSHWFINAFVDFDEENNAEYRRIEDFLIQIGYALKRHKDKNILFLTNSPLYSLGRNGGKFSAKEALFPLTSINRGLYVPLPGFLYIAYRKMLGFENDLSHPNYKEYRKLLLALLNEYSNVTVLSGLEHNFQYKYDNKNHYIISGAGGGSQYVASRGGNDFTLQKIGYSKIKYTSDRKVVLFYYEFSEEENNFKESFQKELYRFPEKKATQAVKATLGEYTIAVPGEQYRASKTKMKWLGKNYRAEWTTPMKFPVFDISKQKGGLEITQRGGGMTSRSFRLKDKSGTEYVLRSVDKYTEKLLPSIIKNTFAKDVVQDQISAAHPYAALMIPKMAEAAKIYHTNPKLFYVPDDPALGVYKDDMAGKVFLFEERPTGKNHALQTIIPNSNIVSYRKAIEKTQEKHKHIIDQKWVLKSRIFDLLINDWDRHDDQWRWAAIDKGKKTIYRPVPRDRDQAFSVVDGIIPKFASKRFVLKKLQGFDYDSKYVEGLIFNARFFDRAFLNQPDLKDWQKAAKKMQNQVSDKVIEDAVHTLPDTIFNISGNEIIDKLKSRRDKLERFATEAYSVLSKKVDVVGTKKRDLFVVNRIDNETTNVKVFKYSKFKKDDLIYERNFKTSETKEIRLFGLKGKDRFVLDGKVDKGIKIRIVGVGSRDSIIDRSEVKGWSKKTIVYDKKGTTTILSSKETKDKTSKSKRINKYNRRSFKYPVAYPVIYVLNNQLDGAVLRCGVKLKLPGFQKKGWGTEHNLVAKFMPGLDGHRLRYKLNVFEIKHKLDFSLYTFRDFPRPQNFFGYGNNTEIDDDKYEKHHNEYRIFLDESYVEAGFDYHANKKNVISAKFLYQEIELEQTDFVHTYYINDTDEHSKVFSHKEYTGIKFSWIYDTRNSTQLPTQGIFWKSNAGAKIAINKSDSKQYRLASDFSIFISASRNSMACLALRAGGEIIGGDYSFFEAPSLGYKNSLRGFPQTRFYGDISFYQNSELRLKLLPFNTYILNGSLGLNFFHDVGRVWVRNEESERWHNNYGFGIWLAPFNLASLSADYAISDETNFLNLRLRYFF